MNSSEESFQATPLSPETYIHSVLHGIIYHTDNFEGTKPKLLIILILFISLSVLSLLFGSVKFFYYYYFIFFVHSYPQLMLLVFVLCLKALQFELPLFLFFFLLAKICIIFSNARESISVQYFMYLEMH